MPPRLRPWINSNKGKFKGDQETLVINASNANPGRARRIQYGPVVVDLAFLSMSVEILRRAADPGARINILFDTTLSDGLN